MRRLARTAAAAGSPRRAAVTESYPDILAYYHEAARLGERGIRRAKPVVKFPESFSFIEQPERALEMLDRFVSLGLARPGTITIAQHECKQIDLCAEQVLTALSLVASRRYRASFRGNWPTSPEVLEIIAATGLQKELGLQIPDFGDFIYFGLRRGTFNGDRATRSSQCDQVTTDLIRYLDRCFQRYDRRLSENGRERLTELVAEVINNCEDHSTRHEWFVSAYLRQPEGRHYGDCHITIFNFGMTVAETLQTLPPTAVLRQDIESLIRVHDRGRYTGGSRWQDTLWTVCALQSGVSCQNRETVGFGMRGNGTVRMMEASYHLGQERSGREKPVMSLVSGNTYVRFDDRYVLRPVATANGETRDVIAFNPENNLALPPDPASVRTLSGYFPGTLLSLRFFVDPVHLDTVPQYAQEN